MKVVLQRVSSASVSVAGRISGAIGRGLVLLVAFDLGDSEKEISYMVKKILNLRIFSDARQKMNLSLLETGGAILSISQFTLAANVTRGRRPEFTSAETTERAEELYNLFNKRLAQQVQLEKGIFGAMMEVTLVNDGPVTFIIEKKAMLTDDNP